MDDISSIIDAMQEQLVETLARWIRIPSVKADPTEKAPFGEAVLEALNVALQDAKDMGFEVRDIDGYAGDVRMGKIGVDPFAILAHLDVVPTGDGWNHDPFGAEIEGDRIYGRGTSDDKGPAVASLFAMQAVKQAGIPLKREVRLILGCDEESGWADMEYYRKHCDMPKVGFSPDASYPVINTEKGMLGLELTAPYTNEGLEVISINVGERRNVVPGMATALISAKGQNCESINNLAADMLIDVKAELVDDNTIKLVSTGVPGHSAYPEHTVNAIGQLLLMLRALGVTGGIKTLADTVGREYDGSSLGIACSDKISGPLTCNLGILRYSKEEGMFATLDIRYSILANCDALTKAARAALSDTITAEVSNQRDPHHVAPNSKLVTALLDSYYEETGRPRECIATGGGTFARCLEEGVAFGANFPDDEELAHQAGEYSRISGLMDSVRIFARAIIKLCAE